MVIGIYAWYYPLNKGVLSVTANLDTYSISIDGQKTQCAKKSCSLNLKTGYHSITIEKKGYFTEDAKAFIKRGKTNKISITLKKVPNLTTSASTPEFKTKSTKTIPPSLQSTSLLAPTWNNSDASLAYLDKNDNKLKIWDSKNGSKVITTLNNIGSNFYLYWSPDDKYLFGTDDKDIYYIDVQNAARNKDILSFQPSSILWSLKSDYLVLNDDKTNLYKIDFSIKKTESLNTIINLKNSIWTKDGELVFFTYDSKNSIAKIQSFNPTTKKTRAILTEYGFPISQIKLDNKKEIYFYNSDKKSWYKLDY